MSGIWTEFTACIEKQIEANERAIQQLAQSRAALSGSDRPRQLIDSLKGNNDQLRALAELSGAKISR